MTNLYVDTDKYADGEGPPVVDAFNSALKDIVRRRFQAFGGEWRDFVFGEALTTITAKDMRAVEAKLLATGYRFTVSAMISATERPDAYKPLAGAGDDDAFSFEHPDARVAAAGSDGRAQRGQGDNVVKTATNAVGVARYFRTSEHVMHALKNGIPRGTIAVIDDSGGTLTAPILEQFAGVICAGGTVRSHLGILTREYGIPCFMNSKVSGIRNGDRIELETTAAPRTAESYQSGTDMSARIWKLA
ncbi:MAG: PEP-utilizing enzyme [Steroidobacteraceae bacterium]|nr:PEP-utilizing enzyme [Steroidobacteraceae bacterium]